MKKIINGKKYDTETAKLMGEWDSSLSITDFGYSEEQLYRKRTGEYFLYGWGGPATHYRTADGSGYTGGEKITPITEERAKKWAEECLGVDEYENIFGVVEE